MRFKRIAVLSLAALLCFGGLKGGAGASELDNAVTEKSDLEKKKEETKKKIKKLEKEKGDIINYIQKLDAQLSEITGELDRLDGQIEAVKDRITTAEAELAEAKNVESNQYVTMKRRIKYMYENGSADYLEIILEAESLSDLLNRAEYIAKISEYDNRLLESYQKTKEDIADRERKLNDELARLSALNEEAAFEKETVEQLASDKAGELDKYNQRIESSRDQEEQFAAAIADQEKRIEDLLEQERKRIEEEQRRREEEERKRLEEERRKKEEAGEKPPIVNADMGNGSENGTGMFRWPLNTSGRITSPFGGRDAPTAGASTNHKGVDIAVPTGTPILAAASGTVVTASYQAAAGNYIMLYHGNSTYTVYMHCSRLAAAVGDEVSQGSVIGYTGATGVATGPHLHFGISINGAYVNPLDYVHG